MPIPLAPRSPSPSMRSPSVTTMSFAGCDFYVFCFYVSDGKTVATGNPNSKDSLAGC